MASLRASPKGALPLLPRGEWRSKKIPSFFSQIFLPLVQPLPAFPECNSVRQKEDKIFAEMSHQCSASEDNNLKVNISCGRTKVTQGSGLAGSTGARPDSKHHKSEDLLGLRKCYYVQPKHLTTAFKPLRGISSINQCKAFLSAESPIYVKG